ncbi:MAG: phosphonate ABC transporter, permease protein PhnE [Tissierellia bacterium]|nr:phosphonate ABC transporter, permease protein PhnE [Tissierellia bacterium]
MNRTYEPKIQKKLGEEPHRHLYIFMMVSLILGMLIWSSTAIQQGSKGKGFEVAWSILRGIFNPDGELLFNLTSKGVPYLLLETLSIAFLGTIIGAIISTPVAFLASSNVVPKPVAWVVKLFIMLVRTIPSFVYGLMFIRVTGPGPFAGLLTMSLTSVGMLTKLFSESIAVLDKNILESLSSLGCTTFEKIRYGILPQLFANFASTVIYRFDINLRDATVLGLVGAGGIGAPLIFAMNAYRWREVGAILLGLIILVMFIEWFSTKLRTKLVRG